MRGDEVPDWVADKEQRMARMRAAKAALEAEAKAVGGTGKTRENPATQTGPYRVRSPNHLRQMVRKRPLATDN